jgi:cyanate permease
VLVFLVGYAVAAVAPILVGALRDAAGGFVAPFAALTAMAALQAGIATRLGPQHRGTVR